MCIRDRQGTYPFFPQVSARKVFLSLRPLLQGCPDRLPLKLLLIPRHGPPFRNFPLLKGAKLLCIMVLVWSAFPVHQWKRVWFSYPPKAVEDRRLFHPVPRPHWFLLQPPLPF